MAAALIHLLLVLGVGSGCATMLPPARSSGATLSDQGISLAVVSQTCAEAKPAGASGPLSADITLAIEVGNPTADPVIVHPERIMLRAPEPVAPGSSKSEDSQPISVADGITESFMLHFVAPGITCSQEMRLDSSAALEWRGGPVTLSAVRFTPRAPAAGPAGPR